MSTAKRVISGSVASWIRIGITMFAQLLFVPVYLKFWSVDVYGIWIAIQALITVITTLDQGYQTFLEFEFLKIGRQQKGEISYNLWSGVWIAVGTGLLEIAIVIVVIAAGLIDTLLGAASVTDAQLIHDAGVVLMLQIIAWVFLTNLTGIFLRALSPFGYYPRMGWWGVVAALITSIFPVTAVMFGANFLEAGIVLFASTILYAVPQYWDIYRLMKKEGLLTRDYSIKKGCSNFLLSLALSGKVLLENARQQGVRVILAPLSGAVALVAFSTMRTGANIVLQGLNTITNPLMPELMRFLKEKDQQRLEASFGTVWIVVILLLAPGVVLLQAFIAPLFVIWTKGKVGFDPVLFTMLSLGVLVYAVAQPGMAVIKGNNLLRPQLFIAIIAAIIVVGGMFISVPKYGIVGAGASLLLAEIVSAAYYTQVARSWLTKNGLRWPAKPYRFAVLALLASAVGLLGMVLLPEQKWMFLLGSLIILTVIFTLYWKSLPQVVLNRAQGMFAKIPGVKNIVRVR